MNLAKTSAIYFPGAAAAWIKHFVLISHISTLGGRLLITVKWAVRYTPPPPCMFRALGLNQSISY